MSDDMDQMLDSQLREAAGDLNFHIPDLPPGDFKPSRRGSTVVASVALVVMAGAAIWGIDRQVQSQPVEVATVGDGSADDQTAGDGSDGQAAEAGRPEFALSDVNLGAEPVLRQEMANPPVGEFVTDPSFGSTIVRLTDAEAGEAVVPIAAEPSAWNVDETNLLLYRTGGESIGHELYRFDPSGKVQLVTSLDIAPADIEQVYWSRVDPDILYYVDGIDLVAYNVADDSSTILMSFEGCEQVDSGSAPVPQSADDNRWGFRCLNGDAVEVMTYDRASGAVQREPAGDITQAPHPVDTGDGYLVERSDRVDLVDAQLRVVRTVPNLEPENIASVMQIDGEEFVVGPVYDGVVAGTAVAASLSNPDAEPVAIVGPDSGYPYPPSGTHRGGTGQLDEPSLAVAVTATGGDGQQTVLDGEIVAIDVASSTAARLAHHRASSSSAFSLPVVSMSPSGRYIVFASDWGGDATNTYLVYRP